MSDRPDSKAALPMPRRARAGEACEGPVCRRAGVLRPLRREGELRTFYRESGPSSSWCRLRAQAPKAEPLNFGPQRVS